jgi:anti-sigma factor RsiW
MTAHRPFDPEHDGPLLSGYADGELDAAERELVESWLIYDERAREELARLVRLKAFTDHLALRLAPTEAWDRYAAERTRWYERGLGWGLLAFALLLFCVYLFPRALAFMAAGAVPLVLRLGLLAGAAGLVFLLISVVRERLFSRRRDRYDDVIR